jgi:hypothetical protein
MIIQIVDSGLWRSIGVWWGNSVSEDLAVPIFRVNEDYFISLHGVTAQNTMTWIAEKSCSFQ